MGWEGDYEPHPRHPAPAERRPIRITATWLAVAIVAVVVGDAYAAYRATSIHGVRALERDRIEAQQITTARETLVNRLLALVVNQPDRRIAAEGVRGIMREQRARFIALAEHAADVRAIDRGLRKTRDALVGALRRDAHDLDHFAAAQFPANSGHVGRRFDEVDRLLDQQRRRWGLTPLLHNPDPKLTAAEDELARLERPYDEPVDATLVIYRNEAIYALDLRTGHERQLVATDEYWSTAIGNGFVAISHPRRVVFIDTVDPEKRTLYGSDNPPDPEYRVIAARTRDSAWVQDQTRPEAPIVRVDRDGKVVEQRPSRGHLVADAGNGALVWLIDAEREIASYAIGSADGPLTPACECTPLDVAPNAVLWAPAQGSPFVADRNGVRRLQLEANPLGFQRAALSPDGNRIAVGWYDGGLQIIDLATGTATYSLRTPGVDSIYWAPDGDRIFFTVGVSHAWYRLGDPEITYLRLRRSGTELIGVF